MLLLAVSACSTTSTVTAVDTDGRGAPANCEVSFFKKDKPSRSFRVLAKVETNVKRNLFFGGNATLENEAYTELRTKTCALGGNAVIVDDYVESRAGEMSHVHAWATAIRLE